MRLWRAAYFGLALVLVLVTPAAAQSVIEKLISPGPLSAAHAKLELRCDACHANFDKAAQPKLCKDCHKAVAADIAAHKGFHGRFRPALGACRSCHSEHAGRQKSIVRFDRAAFDHRFTDYPLKGRHKTLTCAQCHRAGEKFRAAPTACVSCHGRNDPHKGKLGKDCAACHGEGGWKPAKFDHAATRFPLMGAHAHAACAACHADKSFASASRECVSCHRKDDAHHGSLGQNCGSCHTAVAWKPARFDHGTTGFALLGRHAAIACNACHTAPAGRVKLAKACISCHRKDDTHKGRNGPDCGQCHTAGNWKHSTFDHDRTGFRLRGKHAAIACAQCHTAPPQQKKLATTCIACHARDDRHAGQLGTQCQQCHGEASWTQDVRFDHDLAAFPLLGKHAALACKACHATPRFKDAAGTCIGCHRKDDRHDGALGEQCATCHNPSSWQNAAFDHNTQTRFALTGAHTTLNCASCHRGGPMKISSKCIDCHRTDDVHQGGFGPRCEECHSTQSFRALRKGF